MGVVEKLKRLHKQTLLKLKDIKRVLIADEAGVNNEEYLNRARTLNSYLNPNLAEDGGKEEGQVNESNVQEDSQNVAEASKDGTEIGTEKQRNVEDEQSNQTSAKSVAAATTKKTKSFKM